MTRWTTLSLLLVLLSTAGCAQVESPPSHEERVQGAGAASAEVRLSEAALTAARVEVREVVEGPLSDRLELPARIALDPRDEAVISAWIAGQLDSIQVRPGDSVAKGQVLAMVRSPEIGEAVAAYRAAKARDEAADARLERLRRLEEAGVASRAQVLEAEAEHAGIAGELGAASERIHILGVDPAIGDPHGEQPFASRVPVRSPIAGKLLTAQAKVGAQVEPGEPLFRVGDLDEVWLLVDLYERDLSAVQVGQTVGFRVDALPGEHFEGAVDQVGDWVEPDTRTVEVRVVVPNPEHRLKPNMYARAELQLQGEGGASGIVLPGDAVVRVDGKDAVFVEEEPGRYRVRPVGVASRAAGEVLVSEGLAEGERVVVVGAFTLLSELEKDELGEDDAD